MVYPFISVKLSIGDPYICVHVRACVRVISSHKTSTKWVLRKRKETYFHVIVLSYDELILM